MGALPSGTNIARPHLFSIAGAAVVLLLVALLLVVLTVVDLVKVVPDNNNNASPHGGKWQSKLSSCRDRIWRAVPLTAIKTILVVWQVVTQVMS